MLGCPNGVNAGMIKAGRAREKLELEIMRRILGLLGSSLNITQILDKTAELIVDLTDADGVGIFLLNNTGDELNLVISKNLPERFCEAVKVMKLGEGFVGTVVSNGKPEWRCTTEEVRQRSPKTELSSFAAVGSVPIMFKGKGIGGICIGVNCAYEFNDNEIELLSNIGLQLGPVIENALLYNDLASDAEKYRTILETIEDGYFEVDLNGNFTFFNDSLCYIWGYPRDEMVGMNFRLFSDKSDAETGYRAFNEVYRTGIPIKGFSWQITRKDGSKRYVEASAVLIRDRGGESSGFRGIIRDITERKQEEEALTQSEERYRTILDDMEDGYFESDLAGAFTFANDSMCRIMGYTAKEQIGMNYKMFTPEDQIDIVHNAFNEVYKTGQPRKGFSSEFIMKDGSRRIYEVSPSPRRNTAEEIVGFRGIIRDITEVKKAEQQLLATSKLASVGELAAGVAHEINNPLTGVMGYAQLLLSNEEVSADVKEDLNRIHSESQRAAKIVQNLLSFARQHKPEKTYVDLNELIQKTLELRNYELRTNNIEVYINQTPDLPMVMADYYQIQQVVLNMLINAEHATAKIRKKGKITITTSRLSDRVLISTTDNGQGISKDNTERVFDPFYTTKEIGSGTGLGLSICHGIITEHGGSIYVESQKGRGSTFTVELPLLVNNQPVNQIEAVKGKKQLYKHEPVKHVLIIDDEPVVCDILSRLLCEEGCHVDAVTSVKAGLKKIAENSYDLCMIDIKMPGTSGKEMYMTMKRKYPRSAKRVVFMTGDTTTPSTQDFLDSTGRPYLSKPFDSKKIASLVKGTL